MTLAELEEIKTNYKVIELAIDFINPSYNISRAKCLDNTRYILCTLTESGVPRSVKADEVARIRLQKPDKQVVYNDCNVIEDGRILITLTEQILAVAGNAICDIQVVNEKTGSIYSTKNFIINIDKTAVDNSIIASSYEFDALNNLISTNKKLNEELEANEEIRKTNEEVRIANEEVRCNSETDRNNKETIRQTNEEVRITNENVRIQNENIRQEQEIARQINTTTAITNVESATKKANDAADDLQTKLNTHHFVLTEDKGSANGVAELDENGIIISSQLPSYVDDVIEGYYYKNEFYKEAEHITRISGESSKIYIDLSNEKIYRWSGSIFVVISETLALGETSSTAGRGDWTKIAYEHSQSVHAPINAEENQNAFSNIIVDGTTLKANQKTDSLTFVAGNNIVITPTDNDNKIIISSNTDNVSFTQSLTEGTEIGTLTINGENTVLYAPETSGGGLEDTKVTNTLNTTSVAYITGTTSSTTNTGTQIFDTEVYLNSTPGHLTAKTFHGELEGNATTATQLKEKKSISLTGIVEGTGTFDGSGDLSIVTTKGFVGASTAGDSGVGSLGYIAFARIKVTMAYQNTPTTFVLLKRGMSTPCYVSIDFVNTSTTDPGIKTLVYSGSDYGVFAKKIDAGEYLLYITKVDAYERVTVADVYSETHTYMPEIELLNPGRYMSTKPTDYILDATRAKELVTITSNAPTTQTVYYPTMHTSNSGVTDVTTNLGIRYITLTGTTSSVGMNYLSLGNGAAEGVEGNSKGYLRLFSSNTGYHNLSGASTTSILSHIFPDKSGTILNSGTTGYTQNEKLTTKAATNFMGTLTINETDYDIYAPSHYGSIYTTNGSSNYSYPRMQTVVRSGTKILIKTYVKGNASSSLPGLVYDFIRVGLLQYGFSKHITTYVTTYLVATNAAGLKLDSITSTSSNSITQSPVDYISISSSGYASMALTGTFSDNVSVFIEYSPQYTSIVVS